MTNPPVPSADGMVTVRVYMYGKSWSAGDQNRGRSGGVPMEY
jgi:hypothetical protein